MAKGSSSSSSSSKHAARTANASSSSGSNQRDAALPRTAAELTDDALELVRQMLMYLDPTAAYQLPIDAPPSQQVPIPISDWNVLYSTAIPDDPLKSSIRVLSYPAQGKNLFCVRSVVPDITARQFWTLMAESGNRHMWDSTVQEGGNWRWCEQELKQTEPATAPSRQLARRIAARLEYLKLGSIFMVAKPRDMVLLSADVQLPPTDESPLRLVSSCRSEVDPGKPPLKGYTRFDLGVGGFMVEELGDDGLGQVPRHNGRKAIRVTQLSDLGEMASWVPSSVVRMVAQSLVPRSLALIAKAAASIKAPVPLQVGEVSDDVNLHDEDVVKKGERWSRGRGLPGLVGHGVLGRRQEQKETSPTASSASPPRRAPSPEAKISHRPRSRSRSRVPLDQSASTTDDPPLLSFTLQRLSTQLSESSPPPLSPSQQQRLAMQGYFASGRVGDSAASTTTSSSPAGGGGGGGGSDYFQRAGRSGASIAHSPWSASSSSVAGSYMTFGVPSGERTVPGSLNDVEEGTRFPFDQVGGGKDSDSGHNEVAATSTADDTITPHTGDDEEDQDESAGSGDTPASRDTTPSSARSCRLEELRFKDAAELDKRLQRISRALQVVDSDGEVAAVSDTIDEKEEEEGDAGDVDKAAMPLSTPPRPPPPPPHAPRASFVRDSYDDLAESSSDEQDEVDDLLAEALAISLSAPTLRSRFSPQSPPQHLHLNGLSARQQRHHERHQQQQQYQHYDASSSLSPPPSKAARREASELSAILLAGSDALVSCLAPGARQTLVDGNKRDDDGEEALQSVMAATTESASPPQSQPQQYAFRHFFSGTSTSSDTHASTSSSASPSRPQVSNSSSFSLATTQVSSASALAVRGDEEVAGVDAHDRHRNQRSWKRSLAGAPYGLALGMMAMVWARGSGSKTTAATRPRSQKGATRKSWTRARRGWQGGEADERGNSQAIVDAADIPSPGRFPSSPSAAGQSAARLALLRTMSSDQRGGGGGGAQARVASHSRAQMQRSVSSPHTHARREIPAESSDSRRLSRDNYVGNAKLLTGGGGGAASLKPS